MKIKIIYFAIASLFLSQAVAQNIVGVVLEKETQNPISGATVHVLGSKTGTVTDIDGKFSLKLTKNATHLIVRFVGLGSDTVALDSKTEYRIELLETELSQVGVQSERETMFTDGLATQKIQVMNEGELQKAACCNLAESFETNPSVDIVSNDAVVGIKQVQMLGLSSVYTQTLQEGIPYGRGLASGMGMTLIPGSWVEALQISKGTGSVVNGYESIAGAINFDLRKPANSDKFFFNLYQNNLSRQEANLHFRHNLKEKLSTVLLLHADKTDFELDMNEDHFYDMPLSTQYNLLNRWQYKTANQWTIQANVKALSDSRQAGQIHGDYKVNLKTERQEFWTKIGKNFTPYSSLGSMISLQNQHLDNLFGKLIYKGTQRTLYVNLIYQSIFSTTTHSFKTGMSYLNDEYGERFDSLNFSRKEQVGGIFGEYRYAPRGHFDVVLGLRGDYHSLFGWMATPRLHLRYSPRPSSTIRAAAGRGYRTANFLMENMAALVSQRQIFMPPPYRYPFAQESAWNFGVNAVEEWEIDGKEGNFSVEFYRTIFEDQVVADLDKSPVELHFYNLNGVSYSNSLQIDLNQQLFKRLHLRLSYRYLDVKTTLSERLLERPLVAKHRAFANLAYSWRRWKADATANWIGSKRLPANLGGTEFPKYSPSFFLVHAQVTKTWWNNKLDTYLGIENALGFRQTALIVQPQSPFSKGFDGSLAWGPPMGRVVYLGLRFRIK